MSMDEVSISAGGGLKISNPAFSTSRRSRSLRYTRDPPRSGQVLHPGRHDRRWPRADRLRADGDHLPIRHLDSDLIGVDLVGDPGRDEAIHLLVCPLLLAEQLPSRVPAEMPRGQAPSSEER